MENEIACGWCGEWFVKEHHNQCYCSKQCRRYADKQKAMLREKKKSAQQKKAKQSIPNLSMYEMIELMEKLSKERGRTMQYGELQTMIYKGELKGGAVK